MLFNIEHESEDCIIGYVVPDGYSSLAQLRVYSGGQLVREMETDQARPALVAAGRHETGKCGFILDKVSLPGIETMTDLEIFDNESGILIYRRNTGNKIKKKVLRIETHLYPLRRFDTSLCRLFQYYSLGIERFGGETNAQLFLLNKSDSIFLSGRIIYKNYQKYIDDIFSIFITLQDPYYELAERLIILKSLNQQKQSFLGERDKMVFAPVVRYLENMQLDDPKSVKRGILAMPSKILMVLANPVIRQLTTSSYDEMPSGLPIATALDMLSLCDVIGFRHDMESFQRAAFLHAGGGGMNTNLPPPFLMVNRLGDLLKETGVADTFLEKDIELYQHVLAAAQVS